MRDVQDRATCATREMKNKVPDSGQFLRVLRFPLVAHVTRHG